ncbi:vacuolar-type H+-ATPase subunit I/STV1 [Clostridium punense]|uniref:Vacuolar-type H+-ATPase subunit I/STV1 n=1 Tax=Clostridium punense TaxID=1054297 RepID=A0ABS4K6H2_9CLOT|nr:MULTISPECIES: hypothetical protein [Clostridium]EQB90437.1 hypothetical protein M918_00295 [Clostridium sp. BL8]MBP2023365.1 vacuolar-type H+-ATPase subunit I/STV1 [Clostridium punense]
MKGILTGTTAKTNEEFREVIKSRMKIMVILMVIGIITAAIGFASEFYWKLSLNDHMLGVYSGVGVGLFICGAGLWIKNKFLLGNDIKLKESRLSNTDERIQEIGNKAFRIASYVMIIILYATALIGGIFYPILFQVPMFIVSCFLITYVISFKYYNKKM